MKTTPLLTLGTLIGSCLIAAAQTTPIAPKRPHHPHGMAPAKILKLYDKDGDGKLSLDELRAMEADRAAKKAEHHRAMLAKYDKDGDGKLSAAERQVMKEARQAKKAKRQAHHKAMLAKYDTNRDGKLSEAERAAIPKHAKKHPGRKHRQRKPSAAPALQ